MAKSIGGKAAKIALAAAGAAALGTAVTGVLQFRKWAKDPYSRELWFGFLKSGVLISKTEEANHYRVQTGYRWHNDDFEDDAACAEEPEIEIDLPEDALDPQQDEAEAEDTAAPEADAEAGNEA